MEIKKTTITKPGDNKPGNDNSKKDRDPKKVKKLPKTNIANVSYVLTSILALGVAGVIGYKKKDNE